MKPVNEKKFVMPQVERIFEGKYPDEYRPWPKGWSFSVEKMNETLDDGTLKLLTLDISISDEGYVAAVNRGIKRISANLRSKVLTERAFSQYDCEVGCKHCFECQTDTENPLMTTDEVFEMLIEAKDLGLESVKFLGPGELLHNPRLFEILDFLKNNNIHIGIFTKGLALGSDKYSQKFFNVSVRDFCRRLASYPNVTVLLSLTSADMETESARIDSSKVPNIFEIRNRAFENLADAGMNRDPENQRLTLIFAPVLADNIDEALTIYKWAIERNIPIVLAPTMVSGKGSEMEELNDNYFKNEGLVDLYVKIYRWLIQQRIMTIEQVEEEGVSPYPGFACNQFISGMMIRKDGRVQACPGNERGNFIYSKDVRKVPLKEIWIKSLGYRLREQLIEEGRLSLTQPCYAKSEDINTPDGILVKEGKGSIPAGFYEKIMERLKRTGESY